MSPILRYFRLGLLFMTFGDNTIQSTTSVLDTELCALKRVTTQDPHTTRKELKEKTKRRNKFRCVPCLQYEHYTYAPYDLGIRKSDKKWYIGIVDTGGLNMSLSIFLEVIQGVSMNLEWLTEIR